MATLPRSKILRVALLKEHRIIEERLFKRPQDVSLGQAGRSTFILPTSSVPASFVFFEWRSNQYRLLFTDQMEGRVWLGDSEVELSALRSGGLTERRGDLHAVLLPDTARGTVRLGEITLLFQFSSPPQSPAASELPPGSKGFWHTLDPVFVAVLTASLLVHLGTAVWIARSPKPVDQELSLDDLPDRFAKLLIPVKATERIRPKVEAIAVKPEEEPAEDSSPKAAAPAQRSGATDSAAARVALQQRVASKGLLKILGSSGGGNKGALEDVLGGSTGTAEVASALAGASGVGIATLGDTGSRRASGTGSVAGIGAVGTSGGGNVNLGNKKDIQVTALVKDVAPEVDSADVDREALARYVRARIKAIQGCYEKELKRNPNLRGKVVVRFAITSSGRTGEIEIEENSLGNDGVAACIKTVIRGWAFPFKPTDEVAVVYPFLFSPSS